jgi:hypothetical protein
MTTSIFLTSTGADPLRRTTKAVVEGEIKSLHWTIPQTFVMKGEIFRIKSLANVWTQGLVPALTLKECLQRLDLTIKPKLQTIPTDWQVILELLQCHASCLGFSIKLGHRVISVLSALPCCRRRVLPETLAADHRIKGSRDPQYLSDMLQQFPAMEGGYSS